MALPTTYADWDEVMALLEESTDNYFLLVTSAAVNKWSRKKPVRDAGPGANWPCGAAGQTFGFDLSSGTPWDYLKPRGGSYGGEIDEPARLEDFRGYKHDAVPPFQLSLFPGSSQLNVDDFNFTLDVNEDDITVEDLVLGDWYFGVKVGSAYYSAAHPLSDRATEIDALSINIPDIAAGSYTWEAFISSAQVIGGAEPDNVVPLPAYTGYTISGSTEVTLEAPAVHTINNTSINGTVSAYIDGSYIKFTGLNMDLSDFWFKMYHNETGVLLGSDYIFASLDGETPGTRVGIIPDITAPADWGEVVTIRFEDY